MMEEHPEMCNKEESEHCPDDNHDNIIVSDLSDPEDTIATTIPPPPSDTPDTISDPVEAGPPKEPDTAEPDTSNDISEIPVSNSPPSCSAINQNIVALMDPPSELTESQESHFPDEVLSPGLAPKVDVDDKGVQVPIQSTQNSVVEKPVNVMPSQPPPRPVSSLRLPSDRSFQPPLLGLPIDFLHSIASFLTPVDWCSFGECSKGTARVCREVFRRVRMHGFRCATEIVTAMKAKQFADAKELSALYIQSGVPVYPYSLGYSYHTLVWRMGIEVREAEETLNQGASTTTTTATEENPPVHRLDDFYSNRGDVAERTMVIGAPLSYLQEKAFFYHGPKDQSNAVRNGELLRGRPAVAPPRAMMRYLADHPSPDIPRDDTAALTARGRSHLPSSVLRRSNSHTDMRPQAPEVTIQIHRHLLDQHLLGRPSIDARDGTLITPAVSLSADFFHPFFKFHIQAGRSTDTSSHTVTLRGQEFPTAPSLTSVNGWEQQVGMEPPSNMRRRHDLHGEEDTDSEGMPAIHPMDEEMDVESIFEPPEISHHSNSTRNVPSNPLRELHPFLINVGMDVYSTATPKLSGIQHLQSRFASYQRRLEAHLAKNDQNAFDECLLDFWDEFFPLSSGIHYYDGNTAVPRLSNLHNFLTKPCPKEIGVVQCEIERIKLRKKGVGMKVSFFPTYEYRLYICHQPRYRSQRRRDTVLMMARNRGKKNVKSTTASPAPGGKKGTSSYYLYGPEQSEVDRHYKNVNSLDEAQGTPNGAGDAPLSFDPSNPLGRLQSNFVGTEFEIFTPIDNEPKSPPRHAHTRSLDSVPQGVCSDDEGVSESTSSRNGIARLFRRRRSTPSADGSPVDGALDSRRGISPRPPRNARQSGESQDTRRTRTNRRAIANNSEMESKQQSAVPTEVENGAITYTANLLGSRPRIMDVCVPKVDTDGIAGREWKQHIGNFSSDSDTMPGTRMLNHLKQMQHRPDLEELNNETTAGNHPPPEDYGLLTLQNRPPWWNVELGSFVLNFGGRVSVASVKNFQLCDRNDQEYIMLQFGRIEGRHSFTMDFQYPLTAVQAFAIAISSVQSKFSLG
eukprot:Nitzschia sp. Nitz4//scaffold2_size372955//123595//126912//NITZ4_000397-RA/size372955-processed-gene-0.492-mRNA-1//-1//CDS//3329546698//8506//frame0